MDRTKINELATEIGSAIDARTAQNFAGLITLYMAECADNRIEIVEILDKFLPSNIRSLAMWMFSNSVKNPDNFGVISGMARDFTRTLPVALSILAEEQMPPIESGHPNKLAAPTFSNAVPRRAEPSTSQLCSPILKFHRMFASCPREFSSPEIRARWTS